MLPADAFCVTCKARFMAAGRRVGSLFIFTVAFYITFDTQHIFPDLNVSGSIFSQPLLLQILAQHFVLSPTLSVF